MLCLLAFRPCVCRRLQQLQASGDRKDILAMDGNSKLHRRTCGVPYAEIVQSPHVNKLLLRGCSCKPLPKDTLCQKHAEDRDRLVAPMYADIGRHRLKKALHNPGDVSFLEIQRSGFRSWEPASVVPEAALAKYFAERASQSIETRSQFFVASLHVLPSFLSWKTLPCLRQEIAEQRVSRRKMERHAAAEAKNIFGFLVFCAASRKQLLPNPQRVRATYYSCRSDSGVPSRCERVRTAFYPIDVKSLFKRWSVFLGQGWFMSRDVDSYRQYLLLECSILRIGDTYYVVDYHT